MPAAPKRVCFLSYHRADFPHAKRFTDDFCAAYDRLIDRGIEASMAGAIASSEEADYIKHSIRTTYLRDSVVTIVLLGPCTWSRKFVDWEIAASLEKGEDYKRNGLLILILPGMDADLARTRIKDNIDSGYAVVRHYPTSEAELIDAIEAAYLLRERDDLVDNSEPLRKRNAFCEPVR